MLAAACPHCGMHYKVPDSAAGKRTTCKKCGTAFRIPLPGEQTPPAPQVGTPAAAAPRPAASRPSATARPKPATAAPPAKPPPTAAEPEAESEFRLVDLAALADGETVDTPRPAAAAREGAVTATPFGIAGPPGLATARPADEDVEITGAAAYVHYVTVVLKSLAFFRKPSNILTFFFAWVLVALREIIAAASGMAVGFYIGGLMLVGWLILTGWYMAFKLNIVQWAAGGDEDLPGVVAENDVIDGVVWPFWRMVCTYIFAFLPLWIYLLVLWTRLGSAAVSSSAALLSGASPMPPPSALIVLLILTAVVLFVWPMMVLVVACGGAVRELFRLDIMGDTILRSFPAYVLTVLAVWGAMAARLAVFGLIWSQVDDPTKVVFDAGKTVLLPSVLVGVTLYFDIVTMRAIGYYYRCFKHKFAWSWG